MHEPPLVTGPTGIVIISSYINYTNVAIVT